MLELRLAVLKCMWGCAVSSGQPIGVMFTLIMGSNAGGFGLVSPPSTVPHISSPFSSGSSVRLTPSALT